MASAAKAALRALDIRMCINCFKCLGKPCGLAGRAAAVSAGVCLYSCRGCCYGCGSCLVKGCHCCMGCMRLFTSMLRVVLVLVVVFVIWVTWNAISEATVEYYNKLQHDPNVLKFVNRTTGYYDTAKDQFSQGIENIGSNPDVVRLGNRTAELYDSAKNAIADNFDDIKNDKTVALAINGTAEAWEKVKGWKIWG